MGKLPDENMCFILKKKVVRVNSCGRLVVINRI